MRYVRCKIQCSACIFFYNQDLNDEKEGHSRSCLEKELDMNRGAHTPSKIPTQPNLISCILQLIKPCNIHQRRVGSNP